MSKSTKDEAAVPAYRTKELESALQQIKDTTEGSRCVDCEAVHVVASDAMSYVPARAATGDEPDIFADALASQIDAIRRTAFDEAIRIVGTFNRECRRQDVIALLEIARDATPTGGEQK